MTAKDFWAAARRAAARVRGLPAWTSAGVVLSCNFDGGQHTVVDGQCTTCGIRARKGGG